MRQTLNQTEVCAEIKVFTNTSNTWATGPFFTDEERYAEVRKALAHFYESLEGQEDDFRNTAFTNFLANHGGALMLFTPAYSTLEQLLDACQKTTTPFDIF